LVGELVEARTAGRTRTGRPTSWSANSWSANSWSANSWSANSWSANLVEREFLVGELVERLNSWSANSWSAKSWGGRRVSTESKVRAIGGSAVALSAGCRHLRLAGAARAGGLVPLLAVVVTISEIAVVHLQFGPAALGRSPLTEGRDRRRVPPWPAVRGRSSRWQRVCSSRSRCVTSHGLKLEYNVAQFAAGTALGAAMSTRARFRASVVRVPAWACFWLVNHGLVAVAVAVTTRRSVGAFLWDSAPLSAIHSAGNSSIGLLATWVGDPPSRWVCSVCSSRWACSTRRTTSKPAARARGALVRGGLPAARRKATGRFSRHGPAPGRVACRRGGCSAGADVEMVLLAEDRCGPVCR